MTQMDVLSGVRFKFLEGQLDLIYNKTNDTLCTCCLYNSLCFGAFMIYTNKWGDPIILTGL